MAGATPTVTVASMIRPAPRPPVVTSTTGPFTDRPRRVHASGESAFTMA